VTNPIAFYRTELMTVSKLILVDINFSENLLILIDLASDLSL